METRTRLNRFDLTKDYLKNNHEQISKPTKWTGKKSRKIWRKNWQMTISHILLFLKANIGSWYLLVNERKRWTRRLIKRWPQWSIFYEYYLSFPHFDKKYCTCNELKKFYSLAQKVVNLLKRNERCVNFFAVHIFTWEEHAIKIQILVNFWASLTWVSNYATFIFLSNRFCLFQVTDLLDTLFGGIVSSVDYFSNKLSLF